VLLICHFVRGYCVEYCVCVLFLSYFLLLKLLLPDTYVLVVIVVFASCLCVRYKSWKFYIDIDVISYKTKFISLCIVYWILLRSYCSMFVVRGRMCCNLVHLNFSLLICFRLFWIWWIILFDFFNMDAAAEEAHVWLKLLSVFGVSVDQIFTSLFDRNGVFAFLRLSVFILNSWLSSLIEICLVWSTMESF
jgi:hypothetical protein